MEQTVGNITDSTVENVNTISSQPVSRRLRWLWLISLAAFALSVFAVIVSAYYKPSFFDIGAVVAILSLLVMILLGWNVFYALGVRDEMRSTVNVLKKEICRLEKNVELLEKKQNNLTDKLVRAAIENMSTPVLNAKEQTERVAEAFKNRRKTSPSPQSPPRQ